MAISKEAILQEIRRIAAANDGNPPGRLLLESELGISQSAWYGVHWTKWNDAVKEAGFEPNKLTTVFPKEHLLENLRRVFHSSAGRNSCKPESLPRETSLKRFELAVVV